ncbi:MAG: hypothetical protein ACLP50_27680 [Solirubrobacteraceae bacterium]
MSLLPTPGSRFSDTWNFDTNRSASCLVRLPDAMLSAGVWNARPRVRGAACVPLSTPTGATQGSITWSDAVGGLRLSVGLPRTELVHPHTPVAAYPDIIYGWQPSDGADSHQLASLAFPVALQRLTATADPKLVATTDYDTCVPCLAMAKVDVSYDLWLTRERTPRWCGPGWPASCSGGPPASTIEVMIWLVHSRRARPAGSVIPGDDFAPPTWLDGHEQHPRFTTYVCGYCGHQLVSFVLSRGPGGSLPIGRPTGSVSVLIDDFLRQALRALHRPSASPGYLDGIMFGSEVAPLSNGGATRFHLSVSRFCVSRSDPGSAPVAPSGISCG